MSAELFHTIAMIIRRHTRDRKTVPLATRFDPRERTIIGPLPFLFQRPVGGRQQLFSSGAIILILRRLCSEIAEEHPQFAGVRFTPHDFRRIFATELVNSGLPIHIGAALLGHLDVQTTRGYVAVFDEDVIRHYQAHLAGQRQLRPAEEYRPATAQEWAEFEDHFDRRKVELGNCARPYGTSCKHEHACIRCPMLTVSPAMLPRLDELETSLIQRRARAEAERWLGEIEGIDLTLQFLRDKRDRADRMKAQQAVSLGLPAVPPAAGLTNELVIRRAGNASGQDPRQTRSPS